MCFWVNFICPVTAFNRTQRLSPRGVVSLTEVARLSPPNFRSGREEYYATGAKGKGVQRQIVCRSVTSEADSLRQLRQQKKTTNGKSTD